MKPPRRRVFLAGAALLCALAASPAVALDPSRPLRQHNLDAWTSLRGLPQNSVYAIAQTRDGYLWLGTQEGLVRFDGVRFSVFDSGNTPALASPQVQVLLHNPDGSLWLGTEGGGLLHLENGRFRAYGRDDGLRGSTVTALARGARGQLWVGTTEGLAEWRDGRFEAADAGLPSRQVHALLVDRQGTVWVGTHAGLTQVSPDGSATFATRDGLAGDTVTALAEDALGRLWIGTTQGLTLREHGRFTTLSTRDGLPSNWVRALLVDRQAALWVATEAGLARVVNGRSESLTSRDGLTRDSVTALFEDRDGSLWMGTNGGGLNRLQAGPILTYSARHGLVDEVVFSLTGDGRGGLWVGTIRGGVSRFRDGAFTTVPSTDSLRGVRSLHQDPDGGLWVGTDRGLYRYDGRRWVACPPQQGYPGATVRTILRGPTGALWLGTDGDGLTQLQDGRFTRYGTSDGLPSDRVRTLALARDGGLWIGTYGGLARLKDGGIETYSTKNGLSSDLVRALYEDGDGVLWVGTFGGGLNRFKNGRFTSFRARDGLYSDVVYHIVEDSRGYLWMSCNKGIFRVAKSQLEDFAEGRTRTLQSVGYDESAGMLSRECNSGSAAGWKTEDGRLWFPTLKGVVMVDPSSIGAIAAPPAVVLEQVLVDDVALDISRPAELPPGRHRLEFGYAAPSFLHAEGLRFRYRLDGFETSWNDAGTRRVAFYTNLSPGPYTFRVTTVSPDGQPSEREASFAFHLEPYFHQTAAFYWLSGALLAAVAGGAYAWRVRRLTAVQRELARKVEEALANIKVLRGLLPICAWCKKVRDDTGYWSQIESYVRERSEADFSHGICPDCREKHFTLAAGDRDKRRDA